MDFALAVAKQNKETEMDLGFVVRFIEDEACTDMAELPV